MSQQFAILWLILCVACAASGIVGCVPRSQSPEAVLGLSTGLTPAEVARRIGSAPMHQFTAAIGGDQVLCASFGSWRPFVPLCFVFRNGGLEKVIPQALPGGGVPPEQRLQDALAAPALTGDQLRALIERRHAEERLARQFQEPGVLLMLMPLEWLAEADDSARTESWLQGPLRRFDPWKVSLGMSASQVDAAIGPPWRVITDASLCTQARVYGLFAPIEGGGEPEYSWIAVLLHEDRVVRVFSRDFFDPELRQQEQARSTWRQ